MNYTLPCKLCNEDRPRKEYRKRGGGVHKLCQACRKKQADALYKLKAKMRYNAQTLGERAREVKMVRTIDALNREFSAVTRMNRHRIKMLMLNPKPTKATMKYLHIRQLLQSQWQQGLDELIAKVHAGETVGSLRDYMEGKQCLDVSY